MSDDALLASYLEQTTAKIRTHGWVVQAVLGNSQSCEWCYTVGLTAAGLPELVITGLSPVSAGQILNSAAREHLRSDIIAGQLRELSVDCQWRAERVPIGTDTFPLNVARRLYGESVTALQLVWPDPSGAFPDEPDWRFPARTQPLLRNVR